MKFPIAWHEDCLANATSNYEREVERHDEQRERLEQKRVELAIYEYQIKRAKEEGRAQFDRDKFDKKRKPSSAAKHTDQPQEK